MKNRKISIFIFKLIPTRIISRIFGFLAGASLPQFILKPLIAWFSRKFSIVDEYVVPEGGFKRFDEFFTRYLKPGARPVDESPDSIVSPVDARVDASGSLSSDAIIQAKGIDYSVKDLIPSDIAEKFIDGRFMTLYLSPSDYHRIHSPLAGKITGWHLIPGRLFTVQDYMVKGLRNLFAVNERIISYIDNGKGMTAVVKVGALNVGKITLSYDKPYTNRFLGRKKEYFYSPGRIPVVEKGGELGAFHLGSTVILVFENGLAELDSIPVGTRVKLGQPIGKLLKY